MERSDGQHIQSMTRLLVAETWVTIFELFSLWGHVSVLFFMIEKENSTPCFPQTGFQGLNGFKGFYNLWVLVLRVPKYIFISYILPCRSLKLQILPSLITPPTLPVSAWTAKGIVLIITLGLILVSLTHFPERPEGCYKVWKTPRHSFPKQLS